MRLVRPQHSECDSAREAISFALDDAHSEFERLRLQAHLERCASCRSFEARLRGFTEVLRGSEQQQPDFAVVLPRRRRRSARIAEAVTVAAAIAVVASTVVLNGLDQRRIIPVRHQSRTTAALSTTAVRVFSPDGQPVSATPKRWHAA